MSNGRFPRPILPVILIALLINLLPGGAGCTTAVFPTPTPSPTPLPTATPLPTSLPVPPPDSGWLPLRPGLEQRTIFYNDGRIQEQITALRLDMSQYALHIAYRPGAPLTLAEWQAETGALLLVNGGFFTPEQVATGRIVIAGQGSGVSYVGFGGMLAVSEAGVEVRALAERPYVADEPLQFALQSFPMLVRQGEAAYEEEDGRTARRTAVGVDGNGRLLFILANWGGFSLRQFSQFLAAPEWAWGLQTALNLDGGASSGLLLREPPLSLPAFTPLPVVIVVQPR